jgi:copper chaperone
MAVVELTVEGLTCGHCVKAVTAAIQALDAAAKVDITLASGALRAETVLSAARVAEAVAGEGYSAR